MLRSNSSTVYLRDYKTPEFFIDRTDLIFELGEQSTRVSADLTIQINPEHKKNNNDLILQGIGLTLESVAINGKLLNSNQYEVTETTLIIKDVPDTFTLSVVNTINPTENTDLEGLYTSNGNFTTQCEAEGFRRITYYLDRPDVMSRYTTTVIADKESCPVMLSNGNLLESRELENGKHLTKWEDPFKKPSYLFALVAGQFDLIKDHYKTMSGREVELQIYAENGYAGERLQHAMSCLKAAMRWDEENYGRECDLDFYKVVGISDFNSGAMENKGLNIFNTQYLLATRATATDYMFLEVSACIAHEYFHNWTGNRVAPRDWFQLSGKEGNTTFREQSYMQDTTSAVARVKDIKILRSMQFPEDSGPLAHPVQPQSYEEIANFYTTTIYNKGAELFRVLQTALGKAQYRKGMDLYFERYDGKAATIEDFVRAHEEASQRDLSQFLLWFYQAGTPTIDVKDEYDAETQTYTLKISQSCPPTPGQPDKKPMYIPMAMGLLDGNGKSLSFILDGEKTASTETVLLLTKPYQEFKFNNVDSKPLPSLFRNFSDPIKLKYPYTNEQLELLSLHDTDLVNRWDANQRFMMGHIMKMIGDYRAHKPVVVSDDIVEVFKGLIASDMKDLSMLAEMLTLPSESEIADNMTIVDPAAIIAVRKLMVDKIGSELKPLLVARYQNLAPDDTKGSEFNVEIVGVNALREICLYYMTQTNDPEMIATAERQFEKYYQSNLTNNLSALYALNDIDCDERLSAITKYENQWVKEDSVMDEWFKLQASSRRSSVLEDVVRLTEHELFDIKNPNKVRSLIRIFTRNFTGFHNSTGASYQFLADIILRVDAINPHVAANLAVPFAGYKRYCNPYQSHMKKELERMYSTPEISTNLKEIVRKSLQETVIKNAVGRTMFTDRVKVDVDEREMPAAEYLPEVARSNQSRGC